MIHIKEQKNGINDINTKLDTKLDLIKQISLYTPSFLIPKNLTLVDRIICRFCLH